MRTTFLKTLAVLVMLGFTVMSGCSEPPPEAKKATPDKTETIAKKITKKKPAASNVTGGPVVGKEAPEIEGADLDGVEFKLSDYRGKVVMLDFYGDW